MTFFAPPEETFLPLLLIDLEVGYFRFGGMDKRTCSPFTSDAGVAEDRGPRGLEAALRPLFWVRYSSSRR